MRHFHGHLEHAHVLCAQSADAKRHTHTGSLMQQAHTCIHAHARTHARTLAHAQKNSTIHAPEARDPNEGAHEAQHLQGHDEAQKVEGMGVASSISVATNCTTISTESACRLGEGNNGLVCTCSCAVCGVCACKPSPGTTMTHRQVQGVPVSTQRKRLAPTAGPRPPHSSGSRREENQSRSQLGCEVLSAT